jgi:ubiquinone/menaquinone biosynthesis C-methylase UbiE
MGKGGVMKATPEEYAKFIHKVRETKPDAFFTLFDGGKDFASALTIALVIFERLVLPLALKYLTDLQNKKSLDVGYGSGFQVAAASNHFWESYGIDVHDESNFIFDTFARKRVGKKMVLTRSPADNIQYQDNYFDFAHSWVTFLHFPSIEYTNLALKEVFRVLKPGGVAVIFYSRLVKTQKKETLKQYAADMKLEEQHEMGFEAKESLTEVFKKGIGIARWKMTELVKVIGFEVLEHTSSNDGGFIYGQHGIVLRKPLIVELEEELAEIETTSATAPPKKTVFKRNKSIKKH